MTRKPGSRRWRQENESVPGTVALPTWHEGIPPALERVSIRFVCERGHKRYLCGEYYMETFDGSERAVMVEPREDGTLPMEAGRPASQGKALLVCGLCHNEKQWALRRIKQALDSLWQPHRRHTQIYPI